MIIINTLSKDKRAKKFGYAESESQITFYTEKNLESEIPSVHFTFNDVGKILNRFQNKGWFVLGNQVDNVKDGGLGDFIKSNLKKSPKYASHVAAYLHNIDKLDFRTDNGFIELKVV